MDFFKYKDDFVTYLTFERHLKSQTILNHISAYKYIASYFDARPFDMVNAKLFLIERQRDENLCNATLQSYLITIRVICDYLIFKNLLDHNFGKDIPMPKRVRQSPVVPSAESVIAVINCQREYKRGLHGKAPEMQAWWDLALGLLAKTGMRCGELRGLTVADTDFEQKVFHIRDTKTGVPRDVPIPPDSIEPLRNQCISRGPREPLFLSFRGKPLGNSDFGRELRNRRNLLGLPYFHVHSFRNWHIVDLLRHHVPLPVVQQLVGHEDLKSTAHYIKLVMDDLRQGQARCSAIDQPAEIVMSEFVESFKHFDFDKDPRFLWNLSEGTGEVTIHLVIR